MALAPSTASSLKSHAAVFSPVNGLGQLEGPRSNCLRVKWPRGDVVPSSFFRLSLRRILDKRACSQTSHLLALNSRGAQLSLLGPLGG